MCSSFSQCPFLAHKICAISLISSLICCLILLWKRICKSYFILAMRAYVGITVVEHFSPIVTAIMAPKRDASKATKRKQYWGINWEYASIFRDSTLCGKGIKAYMAESEWSLLAKIFKEDLEDQHVYNIVKKSGLHRVSCKYPTFPCENVISWIVSHIDVKTITLSSNSVWNLATFLVVYYRHMYHFLEPEKLMDSHFYATNSYVGTKYVVEIWVKEPSKFRQAPTNIDKTKYLMRAHQFSIILDCRIYGQPSTETFLGGLDSLDQ